MLATGVFSAMYLPMYLLPATCSRGHRVVGDGPQQRQRGRVDVEAHGMHGRGHSAVNLSYLVPTSVQENCPASVSMNGSTQILCVLS